MSDILPSLTINNVAKPATFSCLFESFGIGTFDPDSE
jgi:hypothetical protein